MTLDPARPEKNRRGVWGGVAPPVGLGFGMRPPPGSGSARNTRSGSARNTRNYPSRVQEGIWVWVWDWVLGLGNISRILENVADSDFQYFQASQNTEKSDFQYFQASRNTGKLRFPIFPGLWIMLQTPISNISRRAIINSNPCSI